jgi:predicted nucleotidyltransferase
VDVLLFPPVEYSGMAQRAVDFNVAGTSIRVVSIDDLIALKQAVGRPIDLADIEHLQRVRQS